MYLNLKKLSLFFKNFTYKKLYKFLEIKEKNSQFKKSLTASAGTLFDFKNKKFCSRGPPLKPISKTGSKKKIFP